MELPIDSDLMASLALKLVTDMNKLMEQVEEYKRPEDDQLQDNTKAKAPVRENEVRVEHTLQPRRDFFPRSKN